MKGRLTWAICVLIAVLASGCGSDSSRSPTQQPATVVEKPSKEKIFRDYKDSTVFVITNAGGDEYAGSAIVIDDAGDVLTNNHVVTGGASWTVRDPETRKTNSARIVGLSPCDDLAILHVDNVGSFRKASLSETSATQGAAVTLIGYPLTSGQKFETIDLSITDGLVSRVNAEYQYRGLKDLIQISAPANPGNSGGPVVDDNGSVVGVLSSSDVSLQNVNYAIDIVRARKVAAELLKGKNLDWIGLSVVPNSKATFAKYGVPYPDDRPSVVVTNVDTGSPAADAEWGVLDLIFEAEGQPISNLGDLCSVIRSHGSGAQINLSGAGRFKDKATGNIVYKLYRKSVKLP